MLLTEMFENPHCQRGPPMRIFQSCTFAFTRTLMHLPLHHYHLLQIFTPCGKVFPSATHYEILSGQQQMQDGHQKGTIQATKYLASCTLLVPSPASLKNGITYQLGWDDTRIISNYNSSFIYNWSTGKITEGVKNMFNPSLFFETKTPKPPPHATECDVL